MNSWLPPLWSIWGSERFLFIWIDTLNFSVGSLPRFPMWTLEIKLGYNNIFILLVATISNFPKKFVGRHLCISCLHHVTNRCAFTQSDWPRFFWNSVRSCTTWFRLPRRRGKWQILFTFITIPRGYIDQLSKLSEHVSNFYGILDDHTLHLTA